MDPVSVGIGILICFVAFWLYWEICRSKFDVPQFELDDPTDDEEFQELQDTPHCPDCGSYDLKLIDVTDGVAWLKGYTPETDFYQCKRCFRQFNDETWKSAIALPQSYSTED